MYILEIIIHTIDSISFSTSRIYFKSYYKSTKQHIKIIYHLNYRVMDWYLICYNILCNIWLGEIKISYAKYVIK
ncbi:hypothetical protein SAMN05421842_11369 [Clostridium uliginosum]|uniref:Uncharacterized protein n=1 Tax=Clostridium uliginosum TaxID=119641 RepID=A0A1I1N2W9_9CLOT|nr:hypothetical protein SAMN05421842_11369 [Clostridium uliginosum]